MSTVFEKWGMRCPNCGRDDKLLVSIDCMARLLPDGTNGVGAPTWDSESYCHCEACDFGDEVSHFRKSATRASYPVKVIQYYKARREITIMVEAGTAAAAAKKQSELGAPDFEDTRWQTSWDLQSEECVEGGVADA